MIQLGFITGARKMIKVQIIDKKIIWFDDIWKNGVQIMPKDQNLIEKLRRSGQPAMKMQAALILDSNKGDNLREYEKCCKKSNIEEALADMVRKEFNNKGVMEVV